MIKSKLLTLLLAGTVTLTAVAMASVAAMDRGGTVIDKALLIAMSVVIVLAVHLLLAMTRRPAAWLEIRRRDNDMPSANTGRHR